MNRFLQNPLPVIAKNVLFKTYVAVCTVLSLSAAIFPQFANGQSWYNNAWSFRKLVTIDAAKVGAGTHINFPLLINRVDTDLRDNAQPDADDILFTLSDGTTKLSHEIESYTSTSGALVAWVRIPSLSPAANTGIYMYYGNASAGSQQAVAATWDASYKGVYHLNNSFTDATSNGLNGTNTGTANATGKISNGRSFTRSDGHDYVAINGLMGTPANVTISAWAQSNSRDFTGAHVINIGDNLGLNSDQLTRGAYGFAYLNGTWNHTESGTSLAGTGWHYLTYTFDDAGNVQQFYIDGVLRASTAYTASISYALGSQTYIGAHPNGNRDFDFDGMIDEVRVVASVRAAGWILTEFNNQNDPATFYSVSGQQCMQPPPPPTVVSPVYYCLGETASPLSATGTNLLWSTGSSTAPIPSTATVGTTTYTVEQRVGTCSSPPATITVIVSPAPSFSTPPTNALILRYDFNGSAIDLGGNENHGTLQGGPARTTDRFSSPNSAYFFNGSSQYVSTTKRYDDPENFTISIWFKTNQTNGGMLMGFGPSATGINLFYHDRHLYMSNDGRIHFGVYSFFAVRTISSSIAYNDNNWHLASASLSTSTGMALYIDGVQIATNSSIRSADNINGYWRIGYDNLDGWPSKPSSFYFTGALDDALVYHRTLSPAEIAALYQQPGGASSNGPLCPGQTLNLTAASIPNARYSWTGPNGFTSDVQNPAIPNLSAAHAGLYTVSASVGGCSPAIASVNVTVKAAPSATISYGSANLCRSSTSQPVTRTGTTGGTYSSTAGLSINATSGTINPSASLPGTYTVVYTMIGAECTQTATTVVNIIEVPSATISYGTGVLCKSSTSEPVTLIGSTGGAFSSTPGLSIVATSGTINPSASTPGTYVVTYTMSAAGGCSQQTTTTTVTIYGLPAASATVTYTCVGGSTGTITVSASGGQAPYTYSLNTGAYQSSASFTGLAAGTYTVNVKSSTGCVGSTTATVSAFPNSTDDQTAAGTNSWIGHVYDGTNFNSYTGQITRAETFNELFGGSTVCLPVTSGGLERSIYTETFSVRFRMNSSKSGLYVTDLGSDDASRLYVDNALVYNNWTLQGFSTKASVLMSLNGSSALVYEYYENTGGNQVVFQNLRLMLANVLSANISQTVCQGGTGATISGDGYGALPAGISLSGTGYQWSYSTSAGGTRIDIAGATGAAFTPSAASAPFNEPGTYYIFRKAVLSSTNNVSPNPYVATHESNAAVITVIPAPSATIEYAGSPYCGNIGTVSVTHSGTTGGTYSSTAGLSINATTGTVNVSASTPGTYTVTYTIPASSGCGAFSATTTVTITEPQPASVTISSNAADDFCPGTTVSFTAIAVNGGTAPSYQWKRNGVNVGSNSSTYVTSNLADNDIITLVLTSNHPCLQGSNVVTSNALVMNMAEAALWTGNLGTNWNSAGNWYCGTVPISSTDVVIPAGRSFYPLIISSTPVCRNITVQPGANVNISLSGKLSISGSVGGGGTIDATNGIIEMSGTTPQTIPASIFANKRIQALTINNNTVVTLQGFLALTDVLTISNGSLNTGDSLTLKSTAFYTARVGAITSSSPDPIVGNVTVERYVPGRRKYRLLTSSVTTSPKQVLSAGEEHLSIWAHWQNAGMNTMPNLGTFITGGTAAAGFDQQTNNASMFTYDNVNRRYAAFTSANGKNTKFTPLKAGVAYYMFVYGDRRNSITASFPNATVLRATGKLVTGTQVYNTSSEIPLSNVPGTFTLLGNPYASPINWASLPKSGIANTFWAWDPTLSNTGGYASVLLTELGAIVAPLTNLLSVDQFIQPGQGFFVKTTSASPSLTIREQDKANSFLAIPFTARTERSGTAGTNATLPLIAVNLQYDNAGSKVVADGVIAAFDENFSKAIGPEDASKILNTAESIAIANGSELLSIEGRQLPVKKDTIPLHVARLTRSQYTLQIFSQELDGKVEAFLEDNYLNTVQPLSLTDTNRIAFNVIASDAASSASNRFRITFAEQSSLPVRYVSIHALVTNSVVHVKWIVAEESDIVKYEVERSSDGRNFQKIGELKAMNNTANNHSYELADKQPNSGINYYRVRAIQIDGQLFYSKVVSVSIGNNAAQIKVSPNPVKNQRINLTISGVPDGRYNAKVFNQYGQLVATETIDHQGPSSTTVIAAPKRLSAGIYTVKLLKGDSTYYDSFVIE